MIGYVVMVITILILLIFTIDAIHVKYILFCILQKKTIVKSYE